MAFYYIDTARHQKRIALMEEACHQFSVNFQLIDPSIFDYSRIPRLLQSDFLYRGVEHGESFAASMIEKALLNNQVTTFYQVNEIGLRPHIDSFVIHSKLGLPVPKTVWSLTRDPEVLHRAVEYLGGFPVVLKVLGASQGLGVMRIDSWQSLVSVVDYFVRTKQRACLREYIDVGLPAYSCRAVVLGKEVVFVSRLTQTNSDDFRSNAGKARRNREQIQVSPAQAQVLVRAVESLGLEFGAVDFVERGRDEIVVFEVNFPFRFTSMVTHFAFDLPAAIMGFLREKARSQTVIEKVAV